MIYQITSALFALLLMSSAVLASPCSNAQKDKAYYFAEKAGRKIVGEYGGGNNINTRLVECEYNTYSNEFRLKVDITWNGSVNQNNFYNSEGVLKLSSTGKNTNYSETYANTNLRDWKDLMFWTKVAIVIGSVAAED